MESVAQRVRSLFIALMPAVQYIEADRRNALKYYPQYGVPLVALCHRAAPRVRAYVEMRRQVRIRTPHSVDYRDLVIWLSGTPAKIIRFIPIG